MNVSIQNGGESAALSIPFASQVGLIRESAYTDSRENIGAPSSFTFSVNGAGVDDDHILREGDVVGFRPKAAEKGVEE